MLVHINTVKAFADQLCSIEVNITDEDVYIVFLMSLPPSFDNLVTSLESMSTKDVDLQFIVAKEWLRDWWIATKEVERTTVAFLEEPRNIEETLTCEHSKEWECAMQEEYDSLMTNNTWTLVPLLKILFVSNSQC